MSQAFGPKGLRLSMSQTTSTDGHSTAAVALVVGVPERRRLILSAVESRGLSPIEVGDPYTAMAELCRLPGVASTAPAGRIVVVLSLHGIYREELQIIPAIRRRFKRVEIWVADLDGRSATLAEAMRLGVDGLLGEDGLHELSGRSATATPASRVSSLSSAGAARSAVPGKLAPAVPARTGPVRQPLEPRRVPSEPRQDQRVAEPPPDEPDDDPFAVPPGEAILSADELRALLHDQPDPTPLGRED